MQHDLKSPSKTEINYIRSRELEKNRYFVANVKNDRLRRQFDNSVFGSGGFHDAHKAKLRHLSSRSLIVGQSVNFLELERQRIDHERRSASNFRSLPQRRRKNLKSLEDLKGEIQHKEMLRLLRNFNEKFIEKPKHKYHLLVPSVAPRVLDPDEYDDSHDQDSDRAIIEKFNLIKRQLPKLTEQAKLKEETLEREKLHKTRHPGSVKLLRYVRSDKPRKYEIELTNIFADEKAHATSRPVSIK